MGGRLAPKKNRAAEPAAKMEAYKRANGRSSMLVLPMFERWFSLFNKSRHALFLVLRGE